MVRKCGMDGVNENDKYLVDTCMEKGMFFFLVK